MDWFTQIADWPMFDESFIGGLALALIAYLTIQLGEARAKSRKLEAKLEHLRRADHLAGTPK